MGALEFEPTIVPGKNASTKVELDGLIDMVAKILSGRKDFTTNLSTNDEQALMDILKIGTFATITRRIFRLS